MVRIPLALFDLIMKNEVYYLGIDVGSTTVKTVVLNEETGMCL